VKEEKFVDVQVDMREDLAEWAEARAKSLGQTVTEYLSGLVEHEVELDRLKKPLEENVTKAMVQTLLEITNGVEGWYKIIDIASVFRTRIGNDKTTSEAVSQILKRLGLTHRDRKGHEGYRHVLVRQALLERLRKTCGAGQMQPEPKMA
jgi:hypothetical protein